MNEVEDEFHFALKCSYFAEQIKLLLGCQITNNNFSIVPFRDSSLFRSVILGFPFRDS